MVVKPLLLWVLIKRESNDASYFVANYYFLIGATFIIFNSESHIEYYKKKFGNNFYSTDMTLFEYVRYIKYTVWHVSFFVPVLFFGYFFYFIDLKISLFFCVYSIIEKVWDEFQRYMIFNQEYRSWSIWFIYKTLAFSLSVLVSEFFDTNLAEIIFTMLLVHIILLFYFKLKSKKIIFLIYRLLKKINLKKYIKIYKTRIFTAQILAILSINVLQIDKWIVKFDDANELFTELVLIGQAGSIYLVIIDNIFFSRNRDVYVKKNVDIKCVLNWPFLFLVSVIYILTFTYLASASENYIDLKKISIFNAILIILFYIVIGLTKPLTEFLFWHYSRSKALAIDFTFITLAICASSILYDSYKINGLYISMISIYCLRFFIIFYLCSKLSIMNNIKYEK